VFRSAGRLVILGPVGAGKSAMALGLTLRVLEARREGDLLLPVLLAASTWTVDPALPDWESSGLHDWIAGQLTDDLPGLTASLADEIVTAGVVPIIDGLDELPPARRPELVRHINKYINQLGARRPLVLTSRAAEYDEAAADSPVSGAVTIELRPLQIPEVKEYLQEATSRTPADRWQRVFSTLDTQPGGPLARTLSTPLMLWLARTVYERSESEPGKEPGKLTELPDGAAIEKHLLTELVPAVYRRPAGADTHALSRAGNPRAQGLRRQAATRRRTGSHHPDQRRSR
jgi:hypothetical protein